MGCLFSRHHVFISQTRFPELLFIIPQIRAALPLSEGK